jgi:hypothetical protein
MPVVRKEFVLREQVQNVRERQVFRKVASSQALYHHSNSVEGCFAQSAIRLARGWVDDVVMARTSVAEHVTHLTGLVGSRWYGQAYHGPVRRLSPRRATFF